MNDTSSQHQIKPTLVILGHLGMGDGIAMNGLVRELAKTNKVRWLCARHNAPSLAFMIGDTDIDVIPVEGDQGGIDIASALEKAGERVLRLGYFRNQPFSHHQWDKAFYEQANVAWEKRQGSFDGVSRSQTEIPAFPHPYAFVHDDPGRGMNIDKWRIRGLSIVFPYQFQANNLFDFRVLLENAAEIHAINSAFAILADSIPTSAKRLVLHRYPRPDGSEPAWLKTWETEN